MNILDENIRADQCLLLKSWRIPVQQLGVDIGRKGLKDENIIPLLHTLKNTTFFTRDLGFFERELCHPRYCLVCLDIGIEEIAVFVRMILRHAEMNSKAKRMGTVVLVTTARFTIWREGERVDIPINW